MNRLTRVRTDDLDLNRVQDEVAKALELPDTRFYVRGQKLLAGQVNVVNHGLSRVLGDWIVVRKNAQSDIWETASPAPSKLLLLNCSADVTVDLEVRPL